MMQPQLFQQPSWPFYNIMHSPRDHVGAYGGLQMDGYFFLSTIFSNEFLEDPMSGDESQSPTPVETIADNMEGIEIISCGEFEDVCRWLGEDVCEGSLSSEQLSIEGEDVWSPSPSMKFSEASMVFPSAQVSTILPRDGMEIETQLSIQHLLKAYGEAMEMEQRELAEVIMKCIVEKVSPVGETLERLTLNLFQSEGKQGDYLKQESIKNFEAAFNAFYQIFPYGRFAHFTANSAVLEAMPENVETVHIIDFDMMEGVQWPPMIEAIAQRQKALRLTSIKVED